MKRTFVLRCFKFLFLLKMPVCVLLKLHAFYYDGSNDSVEKR